MTNVMLLLEGVLPCVIGSLSSGTNLALNSITESAEIAIKDIFTCLAPALQGTVSKVILFLCGLLSTLTGLSNVGPAVAMIPILIGNLNLLIGGTIITASVF